MAGTLGRPRPRLEEQLFRESHRFDFFQAVRLLERFFQQHAPEDARQRRAPVGGDPGQRAEVVQFRAWPSLSFPAGSIAELRTHDTPEAKDSAQSLAKLADPDVPPPQLSVAFLGMIGPSGVLPQHYTAMVIDRVRRRDFGLRDFLDLFQHRTISLFYRAWEKYRFPVGYERAQRDESAAEDLFTFCLYCLVGMGAASLRDRLEFDDEAVLYYAGLFSHQPRCASVLERLLTDYFETPVKVGQFEGQWLYLEPDDLSAVGFASALGKAPHGVGAGFIVGQRVWDVQSKLRLRVGPMSYAAFRALMPDGGMLRPLLQMTRLYAGPQFDLDVQPALFGDQVPLCWLGGEGDFQPRLGWNTWVRNRNFDRPVSDAVFHLADV